MDTTSLFNLDLKGKYIFNYADKASYNIIFANEEEKQLYLIITNKYFEVENLYEIEKGNIYFESENIIFTKPFNDNFNEFIFKGFIKLNNTYYKFTIENYKFILEDEVIDYRDSLENIEELQQFEINHFIQKRNYLYFVGYDTKVEEDVFVIFDLVTKRIKYLNSFYSDEEIIILLNILFDDEKIILCGYKRKNNENIPYLTYILNPISWENKFVFSG